jgi:hypothetical protein
MRRIAAEHRRSWKIVMQSHYRPHWYSDGLIPLNKGRNVTSFANFWWNGPSAAARCSSELVRVFISTILCRLPLSDTVDNCTNRRDRNCSRQANRGDKPFVTL